MTVSDAGLKFIADQEGVVLTAYRDQGGVLTCGVGHTGPDVFEGQTVTLEQAMLWLKQDSAKAANCVTRGINRKISQNAFDALVSFTFNLGCGAFWESSLRRLVNAGDMQAAALQFLEWDHVDGVVVPGLLNRRKREMELFLS